MLSAFDEAVLNVGLGVLKVTLALASLAASPCEVEMLPLAA